MFSSLSNARSEEESLTIKRQPYDLPSATYYSTRTRLENPLHEVFVAKLTCLRLSQPHTITIYSCLDLENDTNAYPYLFDS